MNRYVSAIAMAIVLVMALPVPSLAEQGKAQGAVKGDLTNSEGDVGGFAIASTQGNMGAILCVHVDIPTLGGQTVLVFANGGDKGAIILDGLR